MTRHLPSLTAALLLIAISTVEAIPVYGDFSGVVTSTNGVIVHYPVGTPLTGSFSYDLATSPLVSETFIVNIGGQPFAGYNSWGTSGLSFWVDANGFPAGGSAASAWDLYISPGGGIGLSSWGNNITAQVTYEITGIPDAGATSLLLGIALAGVAVTRRFIR